MRGDLMDKERGYGIPRSDVERAVSHYGITETEYCANPEAYPLPERGTGFTTGTAAGNPGAGVGLGTLVVIGLLIWAFTRRR